ncbi:MAG: NifU family protein [Coriobacteriales bacterium]
MKIDRGMLDYVMERIRPQLQADGGDVEVTEIDDEKGIVYVALQGACVGCPMSSLTISQGIERVLKEHVPGVERVLPDLSDQVEKEIEVTVLDDDGNITGTKKVSVDELLN